MEKFIIKQFTVLEKSRPFRLFKYCKKLILIGDYYVSQSISDSAFMFYYKAEKMW
jgi:hypothetical protein